MTSYPADTGYSPYYSWVGAPTLFNGTNNFTGGDSSKENLNQWYSPGDQAYIIVASAMVVVMIPGLGFLYSGLARRKSALSMIMVCMGAITVITFQWYFWGYSLAFSAQGTSHFIGDLKHFGLMYTLGAPSPGSPLIPELLYAFYQMQFCATTAAITAGAVAERGRLPPMMVFLFLWATVVYCPIACWAWNINGWGYKYGVLDYAGGGPVEIASGMSALAYSMVLGRRQEKMMANFRPHNASLIVLGTVFLWFGWLGFNGGSAFGANLRAVQACWNTNLTAMFAAASWTIMDFRLARKWSMVGWCSGAISGLVAATPASGYCTAWGSVILGIVSGAVCNYSTKVKYWLKIDDAMDIFAEHAVGGMLGLLANALFGATYIIGLDGVNTGIIIGGWIDHNWRQLYVQVAYILAATGWSFVVSLILAYGVNAIPGLKLRASEEAELLGMDDDQLGEFAYDYVEVRRDYLAWTPAKQAPAGEGEGGVEVPQHERHGVGLHHDMLLGKDPNGSEEGSSGGGGGGEEHTGVGGDRHAVLAEKGKEG